MDEMGIEPSAPAFDSDALPIGQQYSWLFSTIIDFQMREEVKKLTGGKTTVPQIFFNEIHVGGNDELQALVSIEFICFFVSNVFRII